MTKPMKTMLKFCLTSMFVQQVIMVAAAITATKETPAPAAFLQPRHFNPHPYENGRRIAPGFTTNTVPNNVYNPGPVKFPSNDDNILNRGEIQHPYARLKEKQIDRPKIQHNTRSRYPDEESTTSKKHYAFSYTVRDKQSGDDFSHSQQQTGGAVHGSYKVQLPDGRIQTVKYTADNNGYRADVSYNLIDGHHSNNVQPTRYHGYRQDAVLQKPIVVESIPSLSTPPSEVLIPPAPHHNYINKQFANEALISAQPIYDYYKDLQIYGKPYYQQTNYHQNHVPILSTPSTPISKTIKFPSPSPFDVQHYNINEYHLTAPSGAGRSQYSTIPTPYARGSKPGLVAKLVSSTVRPPYEDITVIPVSKYYHSPTAATFTSTPSYDGYLQSKNTALPSYDVLVNNQNQDYRSPISSTIATNLLKPNNDDYYYK